jgi:hypothetical protein
MIEPDCTPLLLQDRAPQLLLEDRLPPPSQDRAPLPVRHRAPQLWPMALLVAALFWFITTTGGRLILVNDMLSEAYDSQAEHLLQGHPGVRGEAIRHEVLIVNGKSVMYFGPFPAFVRIPLNYFYPKGRGNWSRITGFCAGIIALAAFTGLVKRALRDSQLSQLWRNVVGNACLLGFALGSPFLLLLGDVSIYHEAILWGLTWSIAALYFLGRSRRRDGAALTRSLLAFSFCAAAALFSRVTFGAPLFLIAPFLALSLLARKNRIRNLAVLLLPLAAAGVCHLWLNYAKFGDFAGTGIQFHTNPVQREFALKHGLFRLERVPYSLADYLYLRHPIRQALSPYIKTSWQSYNYPSLYVMPFTETYSSLAWCSSWILFGSLVGMGFLLWPRSSTWMDRVIAVFLLAQVIIICSFMGLAQRYLAEFFPFLIFSFLLFLRRGLAFFPVRYLLIGLVLASIVINSLSTLGWLVETDANTPLPVRTQLTYFIGRTAGH